MERHFEILSKAAQNLFHSATKCQVLSKVPRCGRQNSKNDLQESLNSIWHTVSGMNRRVDERMNICALIWCSGSHHVALYPEYLSSWATEIIFWIKILPQFLPKTFLGCLLLISIISSAPKPSSAFPVSSPKRDTDI